MTLCVVCPPRSAEDEGHDPDRERGLQCCARAFLRLASALNVIPDRVDELGGGGFVERDVRPGTRAVLVDDRVVRVPAMADPVANLWPAGPVPGQRGGAKVSSAPGSSPPVSLDAVDLTSGVNHAARALLARGVLGLDDDQIGHLSAATILHGWVRDWAEIRREGEPMPDVREMARWLGDRLEWAAGMHPALDEFAGEVLELRGVLTALTGRSEPPPQAMDQPCDRCHELALILEPDSGYIVCGVCGRVMTGDEYAEYLRGVIKEMT